MGIAPAGGRPKGTAMTYCEDYPCCGHTAQDPCDWQGPTSDDMLADPSRYHVGCDHEAGFCDYADRDDDDRFYGDPEGCIAAGIHGDNATMMDDESWECDSCGEIIPEPHPIFG